MATECSRFDRAATEGWRDGAGGTDRGEGRGSVGGGREGSGEGEDLYGSVLGRSVVVIRLGEGGANVGRPRGVIMVYLRTSHWYELCFVLCVWLEYLCSGVGAVNADASSIMDFETMKLIHGS